MLSRTEGEGQVLSPKGYKTIMQQGIPSSGTFSYTLELASLSSKRTWKTEYFRFLASIVALFNKMFCDDGNVLHVL